MLKEDFRNLVEEKLGKKLSYVAAVYAVLGECLSEELIRSKTTLACGKGCAVCCHQMISCTKPEMDEIISFINRIEKRSRRNLKKRLGQFAGEWEQYYLRNQMALKKNPFLFFNDWKGKPCPFLGSDGACVIYPARIIDCRTLSSLDKCVSFEINSVKRVRFDCEMWANNLILEYQEERCGYQAVSPLGQWLLLFKNNNWQPIEDDALRL